MNKLSNDYIVGFVDGEGCFALKYRVDRQLNKNKTVREYKYWGGEFVIVLHPFDFRLLELVRGKLGVGQISYTSAGDQVRFSVQNTQELKDVIVPFFEKNPLHGIKSKDFELWAEAIKIIAKHKSKTRRGIPNPVDAETQKTLEGLKSQIDGLKRREVAI